MSEKKTAEIKFRIEPSRKATWQHAAAERDTSLSELIASAVDAHLTQGAVEDQWSAINPVVYTQTFTHPGLRVENITEDPSSVDIFQKEADLPKEPAPWSFEAQNA